MSDKIRARYSFEEQRRGHFFDAASIGLVSVRAKEEAFTASAVEAATDYEGAERSRGPELSSWSEAVADVRRGLGTLLGVPGNDLTLYHNTTAGVQRIFTRLRHLLGGSQPTLLTTDLEYPGIMALADENWQGRAVIVEVADLIWGGKSHLVEEVLRRAVLIARPSVIYVSHVARASGFQMCASFLKFVRRLLPRTVIIVDGAQAAGNAMVESEFLSLSDFYVTSGHKWLCGEPTLGVVYAHESWKLDDPAQGYSPLSGSRGTGSLVSLKSLARSLEDLNGGSSGQKPAERRHEIAEHNQTLARLFVSLLDAGGVRSIPGSQEMTEEWVWNGIVVLPSPSLDLRREVGSIFEFTTIEDEPWRQHALGGPPLGLRFFLEVKSGEERSVHFRRVKLDEQKSPLPDGGAARFCFHYYHCAADVEELAAAILRVKDACST